MAVTVTAVVTALLLFLLLVVENTAGRKNNATTVAVHAAVVSLMDASRGGRPYQRMRGLFLHSLRRTAGYRGPCIFMVTGGSPHVLDEEMFERYGTRTVQVDLIKQSVLNARHHHGYGALLSKLHVWALTTYDIVVYYDSDVVFFRNPVAAALAACGGALAGQKLCATRDTALTRAGSGRPLFNAGFLVLRPDLAVHADLLRSLYLADGQFFPDQVTHACRHPIDCIFRQRSPPFSIPAAPAERVLPPPLDRAQQQLQPHAARGAARRRRRRWPARGHEGHPRCRRRRRRRGGGPRKGA